eukprot:29617-Hanusia_phi.AAC.1
MPEVTLPGIDPKYKIRCTGETPDRYCVFDVILSMCQYSKIYSYQVLDTIKSVDYYPELNEDQNKFLFPGKGQRPQSVVEAGKLAQIIMLLPGPSARCYRVQCANFFLRIVGGDPSVIEDIQQIQMSANPVAAFMQATNNNVGNSSIVARQLQAVTTQITNLQEETIKLRQALTTVQTHAVTKHDLAVVVDELKGVETEAKLLVSDKFYKLQYQRGVSHEKKQSEGRALVGLMRSDFNATADAMQSLLDVKQTQSKRPRSSNGKRLRAEVEKLQQDYMVQRMLQSVAGSSRQCRWRKGDSDSRAGITESVVEPVVDHPVIQPVVLAIEANPNTFADVLSGQQGTLERSLSEEPKESNTPSQSQDYRTESDDFTVQGRSGRHPPGPILVDKRPLEWDGRYRDGGRRAAAEKELHGARPGACAASAGVGGGAGARGAVPVRCGAGGAGVPAGADPAQAVRAGVSVGRRRRRRRPWGRL